MNEQEPADSWSFVDQAVAKASQRLPVDPSAMSVVLMLHRLTQLLVYDLESNVHRPRGWSWSGFRVLFVLWVSGPLDAKTAASLAGMSRAAVSAVITTLERDELIYRQVSDQDKRSVRLDLTEQGRSRLEEAFVEHNAREQRWMTPLSTDARAQLVGLLGAILDDPGASELRRRR